jgi:hypothetical protein
MDTDFTAWEPPKAGWRLTCAEQPVVLKLRIIQISGQTVQKPRLVAVGQFGWSSSTSYWDRGRLARIWRGSKDEGAHYLAVFLQKNSVRLRHTAGEGARGPSEGVESQPPFEISN